MLGLKMYVQNSLHGQNQAETLLLAEAGAMSTQKVYKHHLQPIVVK